MARKIVAASDVVVENFRPGVIDRLGLGYEACKALKSDIIFCSVSGYGQKSPMRDYPAIDNIVQAASAMTMQSGEDGGGPVRIGFAPVDTYYRHDGGLCALSTRCTTANAPARASSSTRSMLDSAVAFMTSLGRHISGPG